jgi:hypothetical protein
VPTRTLKQLVAISVKLEVNTPDELKKVIFAITKGTEGDLVTWTVNFEYHERSVKTATFVKIVDLDVEVKTTMTESVERAATKGFTKPQAEFAAGPGASAAKRLSEGKTTEDKAANVIGRTFSQ